MSNNNNKKSDKVSKVKSTNAASKAEKVLSKENIEVPKQKVNPATDSIIDAKTEVIDIGIQQGSEKQTPPPIPTPTQKSGATKSLDNNQKTKQPEEQIIETISNEEDIKKIQELELKNKQLLLEHEKLVSRYSNLFDENLKLKKLLDDERQQLIHKLEEKSKKAQEIIDEKYKLLEDSKSEDIKKAKNSFAEELINDFLQPILLFETTIVSASSNPNPAISGYVQGFMMIINMFNEKLDSLGVAQINVNVGDEFNEKFMSAFDVEQHPNIPPNKVVKIIEKGFVYDKKVIKYASVVVSK
ncbi:MAG: nucleotide exchange factor GrpE [Mycoplasma sp.]